MPDIILEFLSAIFQTQLSYQSLYKNIKNAYTEMLVSFYIQ